jgi:hypothetical protein
VTKNLGLKCIGNGVAKMNTVDVNSMTQALEYFFEGSDENNIGHIRSSYVFRGVNNYNYELIKL